MKKNRQIDIKKEDVLEFSTIDKSKLSELGSFYLFNF